MAVMPRGGTRGNRTLGMYDSYIVCVKNVAVLCHLYGQHLYKAGR